MNFTSEHPTLLSASGSFPPIASELDRCSFDAGKHFFMEAITKKCMVHHTIQPQHITMSSQATHVPPPPLSNTPLGSFVALTVIASIAVVSAILWLAVAHPERKTVARIVLQKNHECVEHKKDCAARSIQASWRRHQRTTTLPAEEDEEEEVYEQQPQEMLLSGPTMLSLFGGNDPYRVSSPPRRINNKTIPMTHVQYHLLDDEESSSSSSLPSLMDHNKTSRKHPSFRGILLGLTLVVLLARCFIIPEDPWTAVERFSNNRHKSLDQFRRTVKALDEQQPTLKRGPFDCDCNSYAKTLNAAYGPFVPF